MSFNMKPINLQMFSVQSVQVYIGYSHFHCSIQSPLCCHCSMIPSMPALIPALPQIQLQRNDLRQSLIQQEMIVGTLTQNLVNEQKKLAMLLNLKQQINADVRIKCRSAK